MNERNSGKLKNGGDLRKLKWREMRRSHRSTESGSHDRNGIELQKMVNAAPEAPEGPIGFETERTRIQEALDAFEAGQRTAIALIAEPFAGRTTLLRAIEAMTSQEITKLSLSKPVTDKDAFALPAEPAQIVLIDTCHFLYLRTIGGFRFLQEFLESAHDLRYEFEFRSEVTRHAWQELTKRRVKAPEVAVIGEQFTGEEAA